MVGFVVWGWVVLLFTIHSKERVVVLLLSVLSLHHYLFGATKSAADLDLRYYGLATYMAAAVRNA